MTGLYFKVLDPPIVISGLKRRLEGLFPSAPHSHLQRISDKAASVIHANCIFMMIFPWRNVGGTLCVPQLHSCCSCLISQQPPAPLRTASSKLQTEIVCKITQFVENVYPTIAPEPLPNGGKGVQCLPDALLPGSRRGKSRVIIVLSWLLTQNVIRTVTEFCLTFIWTV